MCFFCSSYFVQYDFFIPGYHFTLSKTTSPQNCVYLIAFNSAKNFSSRLHVYKSYDNIMLNAYETNKQNYKMVIAYFHE